METTVSGSCQVHQDRQAVETCASCGRLVCLACAIPVRGSVLCRECAARTVGDPPPAPAPPPRGGWAGPVILTVGLVATVLPWDRFGGVRSSFFGAWRPGAGPWPIATALSLLVAVALAWRRRVQPHSRRLGLAVPAAAALAGLTGLLSLYAVPDYVRHTPAPYVVTVAALAALGIEAARRRRARRARPGAEA